MAAAGSRAHRSEVAVGQTHVSGLWCLSLVVRCVPEIAGLVRRKVALIRDVYAALRFEPERVRSGIPPPGSGKMAQAPDAETPLVGGAERKTAQSPDAGIPLTGRTERKVRPLDAGIPHAGGTEQKMGPLDDGTERKVA